MKAADSPRRDAKMLSVIIACLFASAFFFTAPVALANTPTGDCGSGTFPGNCPAGVITTLGASSGSVSTTGLTTTNTNDLIIAIVIVGTSSDSIGTPTVGSSSMSGPMCSYSSGSGQVEIWYLYSTSAISSQVVSAPITGTSGDTIGISAFGVNGLSSTATLDVACQPGTGTASPATVTLTGLSYSNDFIVGGYYAVGTGSGVGGFTGSGSSTVLASATGTKGLKDGSASSYQLGATGQTSQTVALAISGTFSHWTEVSAAIEATTPQNVPLFPEGFAPALVAMVGGYLLFRKRVKASPRVKK